MLACLLIVYSPASAAIIFFDGGETGGGTGVSVGGFQTGVTCLTTNVGGATPVTGAWHFDLGTGNNCRTPGGMGLTTIYTRFYWQTSSDGADNRLVEFQNAANTAQIVLGTTVATHKWRFSLSSDTVIASSSGTWTAATWYLMEVKAVVSATVGGLELKVCAIPCSTGDEVTQISSFTTNTSPVTAIDHVDYTVHFGGGGHTERYHFDNIIISNSGYVGAGGTLARQGVSGTPTYNAWTKTGTCSGGGIDTCWSTTPFATTAAATSAVLVDAQTMIVHDFATIQTGNHGTEVMGNASTIIACKIAWIAKASSAATGIIRRRLSGTDFDTVVNLTTADAYKDDGIWTTTVDVLRSTTMEIGAVQAANGITETVEDMWLMCDFLDASFAGLNITTTTDTSTITDISVGGPWKWLESFVSFLNWLFPARPTPTR